MAHGRLRKKTELDLSIEEQRRHRRVVIPQPVQFLYEGNAEGTGIVQNISGGGVYVLTNDIPEPDSHVVLYIEEVGRIECTVLRTDDKGFAAQFNGSERKRERIIEQLTWLINRHLLKDHEARRHRRVAHRDATYFSLVDGSQYECIVIDMSLSGAALESDAIPDIGHVVSIGRMQARVVRHIENGFAVEFIKDLAD